MMCGDCVGGQASVCPYVSDQQAHSTISHLTPKQILLMPIQHIHSTAFKGAITLATHEENTLA